MTGNSEEIAELQRAHVALGSKVKAVLPTLATKADLEAMGRHLAEEMTRRFDEMTRRIDGRLDELTRMMTEAFNRIWLWIAGTLVAILVALIGANWFQRTEFRPSPPVVYHVYPEGYVAAPQLAPPTRP